MRSILRWAGVVLGLVVAVLVVSVFAIDGTRLKGYVESQVGEAVGRQLTIEGDIDVDWSLVPRVRTGKIRLGNAAWAETRDMVEVDSLAFQVRLADLLTGDVVLPQVHLVRPVVRLERSEEGIPNWDLGEEPSDAAELRLPAIGELRIEEGTITYRDPSADAEVRASVATAKGKTEGTEPTIQLSAKGTYQGEPLRLELQVGSVLSRRREGGPCPIRADLRYRETLARLEGTLTDPVRLKGMDLDLHLEGPDPARLFPLVRIPVPHLPPFRLEGHLARQGETWTFRQFAGRVGDSDLSGDLTVDTSGERARLTGTLRSKRLDPDDLGGVVGAAPATGRGETASDRQEKRAAALARRDRIFPDAPLERRRLLAVDADVRFEGEEVGAPGLPVRDVSAHLILDHGLLRLAPLEFGIAGGVATSRAEIDGREDVVHTEVRAEVRRVDLEELTAGTPAAGDNAGTIGGRIEMRGPGDSVADFLASASGRVDLAMSGGRLDALLVELAGLDVGQTLAALVGDRDSVPVRCAVAVFALDEGVLRSKAVVMDTDDSRITAEGTIDLGSEALDLRVTPHPKDPSLLSGRAPLEIGGTLKKPSVAPDETALLAQGAAAAALGVLLTPAAALIPLVDLGLGEDADCRALVDAAKEAGDQKPPESRP